MLECGVLTGAILLASSVCAAVLPPVLPPSALSRKIEVELRVPLSASGYAKLETAFAPSLAADLRTDSYFDRHDGARFVLKRLPEPIKVRVKDDGSAAKVQVSRPTSKETVADGGLSATVTTIESRQTTLASGPARELSRELDAFFAALPGTAPIEELAARAGRVMDGARWEGRDLVEAAAPGSRLLPAARSRKERLRMTVRLDDGTELSALLGKTYALDERGNPVVLYEFEAETSERDPAVLRELARRLLLRLRALGLTASDMGGLTPDAFVFAEARLRG